MNEWGAESIIYTINWSPFIKIRCCYSVARTRHHILKSDTYIKKIFHS
jgi:hypothetical protein